MRFQQGAQLQRGVRKAGIKAGEEQSSGRCLSRTMALEKSCKPNPRKVKEQKMQRERGETGSQQGIARNGNKQWIIQVWQEEERLQRNQEALPAPREFKGNN